MKLNGTYSIDKFLDEVLYNKKSGYYSQIKPFGKEGDLVPDWIKKTQPAQKPQAQDTDGDGQPDGDDDQDGGVRVELEAEQEDGDAGAVRDDEEET